ncbi:MAG: hypothetical protein WD273_02660 [Trueperaceae bacterium]
MADWLGSAGDLSQSLLRVGQWTSEERAAATDLAKKMLVWGGVARQSLFSPQTVENVFRKALGLAHGMPAPMNSGWPR